MPPSEGPPSPGSSGARAIGVGAADAAVAAFKAAGGVVDHVLVLVPDEVPEEKQHGLAVVAGLEEIGRRWDEWVERQMAQTRAERNRFRHITITASQARGRRIDFHTFVGRAYDHETGRIVSLWQMSPGGAGSKSGAEKYVTDGYAEAFSDPPYPLRANLDQVNGWFESINRSLFGGLSPALRIWEWETDWSNWFDDGHDWWGSFCWTVQKPASQAITVIAASATD